MESNSSRRAGNKLFLPMINNRMRDIDYERQKIIGGTLDFIQNRMARSYESNNLYNNVNLYPNDMAGFLNHYPESLNYYRPIRYFYQRPIQLVNNKPQVQNRMENIKHNKIYENNIQPNRKYKWAKPLKPNDWIKEAQEVHYPIAQFISPVEFRKRQVELNELQKEAKKIDPQERRRLRDINKKYWNFMRKLRHLLKFYKVMREFSISSITLRKNKQLISQASKADIDEIAKWIMLKLKSVEDFCNDNLTQKFVFDRTNQSKTDDSIFRIKNFIHQVFHELSTNITLETDIPYHIKTIMSNYINDKVNLPDNFLTTFEFNRLEFDMNLSLNRMYPDRQAMIVCFIVLYRVLVLEIMMNFRKYFTKLITLNSNNSKGEIRENLSYNMNFLIVIMHHILKDAFAKTPKVYREYFKDTHLFKRFVFNGETYNSIQSIDNQLELDVIEFADRLPKVLKAEEFIKDNFRWVNMYKMSAFSFCIQFVENITK